MVYETKTYKLCHQLADNAKDAYHKLLEDAASEILYKKEHPVKWLLEKISEFFADLLDK